jgi:hypothetical protein
MARRSPTAPPAPDAAVFEVERFGWTAPDRLELHGRWTGIRGVRFVRPTLTLRAADGVRRALALLEHKPWAAEDGVEWVAAFPWRGEAPEFESAELAVATDIEIALPPPKRAGAAATPRKRATARKDAAGVDTPPRERVVETPAADDALRAQLAGERAMVQRLRAELDRARNAAASSSRAGEREAEARARAEAERDAIRAERDEVATERDAAVAARDAARRDRDALDEEHRTASEARARELRAVAGARDAAAGRLEALERELATARDQIERLGHELDAARRTPETLRHELAALAAARDAAVHDRDVVRLERDALLSQLERHRATRV